MSLIKSPGFILHKISFSESSLILKVYTKQSGLISMIAKGAKGPKSKFKGLLDSFHELQFLYPEKSKSEILTLTEITLLKDFPQIKTDIMRQAIVHVLFETYLRYLHGPMAHDELYTLLGNFLFAIEAESDSTCYGKILCEFLLQFCLGLGFSPQFNRCVHCEGPLKEFKVNMHIDLGGPICGNCKVQQYVALQPMRINILRWLHQLQKKIEAVNSITLSEAREAETFLFSFLGKHSGGEKKLKALEFYRHLQHE